jgi:hypothetical protein
MRIAAQLPARGGIGLKAEHYRDILDLKPDIGFFEIHAENYMGAGGPPHRYLDAIRRDYPLSLHGVGLSIGGAGPLDREHIARLKELNRRYEPGLFSEHLAWSTHESAYLADLLPLPYTEQTLKTVCVHIDQVQDGVGRQMLLENPSSYMAFEESTYSEADFIREVAARTGCGLLLDVNNVFVSAVNLGFTPQTYLDAYPLGLVLEIHLAGHATQTDDEGLPLLIDDHGSPVADPVWSLHAEVIGRTGPLPSLIERDNDVPPLTELVREVLLADRVIAEDLRRRAA